MIIPRVDVFKHIASSPLIRKSIEHLLPGSLNGRQTHPLGRYFSSKVNLPYFVAFHQKKSISTKRLVKPIHHITRVPMEHPGKSFSSDPLYALVTSALGLSFSSSLSHCAEDDEQSPPDTNNGQTAQLSEKQTRLLTDLETRVASNKDNTDLEPFQKVGLLVALGKKDPNYTKKAYTLCNDYFGKKNGFSFYKTGFYCGKLYNIRQQARKALQAENPNVREVYHQISKGFVRLTKTMIEDALAHLPIPKCKYSFIGLGSLAREEQTPYSDLEFAVIVDKKLSEEEKAQFVLVSHWIHHQILLLGETPLAELDINGVYDREIIKKKFSLDGPGGQMAPSWNPGLVGTVKELLHYQSEKEFKKRIITPGELRNVVTISGNKNLTEKYKKSLHCCLRRKCRKERALRLLEFDGDRFTLRGGKIEKQGWVVPIKYELYRAIQLRIEGISLFYGIQEQNIFDRINKLKEKKVFTKEGAANLIKTASTILKMRCKYYLEKDYASEDLPVDEEDEDSLPSLPSYLQNIGPF